MKKEGLIRYKGRLCAGDKGEWREKLMKEMHDFCIGGILVCLALIKG
jgi:hypothetical protein